MAAPESRLRAGLVGAGEMGLPLAERVAAAGIELRALARRDQVAAALTDVGAEPVGTLGEVAAVADVVVVCVHTDEQVAEVALGPDGLLAAMAPGAVLVVHTTGSPGTAQRLATAGEATGVAVVDAPFSGSPAQVQAGAIPLLVGGGVEAVEAARSVLVAYGEPIHHLGPVGAGQRVKLLNNLLLAANAELAMQVVRLGEQIGMAPADLVEVLSVCSGRSFALTMLRGEGPTEDTIRRLGGFLGKDIDVAVGVAAELGLDLGSLGRAAAEARARFRAAGA